MLAHETRARTGEWGMCQAAELFVFFVGGDGLQILGLEDLPAVETFHIIDAVTPGNNFGTEMVAHNKLMSPILVIRNSLSRGSRPFSRRIPLQSGCRFHARATVKF